MVGMVPTSFKARVVETFQRLVARAGTRSMAVSKLGFAYNDASYADMRNTMFEAVR